MRIGESRRLLVFKVVAHFVVLRLELGYPFLQSNALTVFSPARLSD